MALMMWISKTQSYFRCFKSKCLDASVSRSLPESDHKFVQGLEEFKASGS